MAAHYDDPTFSYQQYWQGRDYENRAEIIAITELLSGLHFDSLTDVGGGYGRLIPLLSQYSSQTILIEPSQKQRRVAQKYLRSLSHTSVLSGTAQKTGLPAASQDAAMLIRVLHHLPDPSSSLRESARILKPNGHLLIEFANSVHFKSRLKSLASGTPIPPVPLEKRSPLNIRRHTIPFVNHHPSHILKLLSQHGFVPLHTLSVSNFRHPLLKKFLPLKLLLILESFCQPLFSRLYFGPSIFILARRLDKHLAP